MKKKKTHLWPKQCIWCCLGPFLSPLPLPSHISQITIIYVINISQYPKKRRKKKKNFTYGSNNDRHVIQACFHNCCPSCSIHHRLLYIYAINISQYSKKRRRKKKELTYGPNNASGVVWASFCCRRPSHRIFHRLHLYML